jgi:hypothetical protein
MGCSGGAGGNAPSSDSQGVPEAGGPIPSFDSGSSSFGDASYPTSFGDGGSSTPTGNGGDGGQSPSDGGQTLSEGGFPIPGTDGGVALCNPLDPKYSQEYLQASLSGLPTPCNSCTAGECCYDLLGCVPQ